MKQEYELLHKELLQDIERCMSLELPEKERAESCFWIANNYWDKLKGLLKAKVFEDEYDEIDFFRNVKPQFTHYIEYFVILTEALMFVPRENLSALIFWDGEMKRFKRFCDKHNEFVSYYESGQQYNDSMFYLRKNSGDLKFVISAPVYDVDADYCTSHDSFVRSYLAQKKYYDFAKKKLEEVKIRQAE